MEFEVYQYSTPKVLTNSRQCLWNWRFMKQIVGQTQHLHNVCPYFIVSSSVSHLTFSSAISFFFPPLLLDRLPYYFSDHKLGFYHCHFFSPLFSYGIYFVDVVHITFLTKRQSTIGLRFGIRIWHMMALAYSLTSSAT